MGIASTIRKYLLTAPQPSGGGSGSPGGSDKQIQYNNAGAFGGISNGSAGDVLTSNGAGSAPSFQAPGSGAPSNAEYLVETANGSLSNEVVTGTTYMTTAAYASRQAAAKSGRLFLPNDSFYFERDTGAAWAPWGPIFPLTAPDNSIFSWTNQGGASVSTTNGGIFLLCPVSATASIRIRRYAAPATPYTITAAFLFTTVNASFQNAGLVFRESGTGRLHTFSVGSAANIMYLVSAKWTNETTYSADYKAQVVGTAKGVWFLRIADNGVNRICSLSADGQNWIQFHSIGRTDFLTADQVGFFGNEQTNSTELGVTVISWNQA